MIHCGFQDWPEEAPAAETIRYDDPYRRVYHGTKLGPHGLRTLEEMKKLGIIVDMAHLLPEGFDDVVSRLEGLPFVYSHGGCGALTPNERTFDDARIAQLAAHGGVYGIGVCHLPDLRGWVAMDEENERKHTLIAEGRSRREQEMGASMSDVRDFVRQRYSEWNNWEELELGRLQGYVVKFSLATVVAHIQYLRDRFGPEIVGYGPDYEQTFQYVRGLEEADKTPNLTRALLDEGFSPAEVQGALGHNFMRVFEAILG
jgi:membrane dipeptidase